MKDDHVFCRLLLKVIMDDVRLLVPVEQRKKAWTYKHGSVNPTYEFHGPRDFYWYGQAHCKWHARAEGWTAYLNKYHPEWEDENIILQKAVRSEVTCEDTASAKAIG